MMASLERREHLMIGALTADLTHDEQRELHELADHDQSLLSEIDQLRALLDRVDCIDGWVEAEPSPALDAAIAAIAPSADASDVVASVTQVLPRAGHRATDRRATSRRASRARAVPWRGAVAAAALVVVGAGGALGVERIVDQSVVVSGDPGTLGAVEQVSFASGGAGRVDGSVVAHTWGTEAILTVDGLETGQAYDVQFVDGRGSTIDAGSFLGSDVEINCSMNAAIMRDDVAAVRIVAGDGTTIGTAELPPVTS